MLVFDVVKNDQNWRISPTVLELGFKATVFNPCKYSSVFRVATTCFEGVVY